MNYLPSIEFENASGRGLTKLTKIEAIYTFVGFVTWPYGAFQNSLLVPCLADLRFCSLKPRWGMVMGGVA